jgi:hypothetical protein
MKRICQLYNVSEQDAVKMMTDTDKRRMTNYNFYTDQRWGKASISTPIDFPNLLGLLTHIYL